MSKHYDNGETNETAAWIMFAMIMMLFLCAGWSVIQIILWISGMVL